MVKLELAEQIRVCPELDAFKISKGSSDDIGLGGDIIQVAFC